jgi:hypothetical protein
MELCQRHHQCRSGRRWPAVFGAPYPATDDHQAVRLDYSYPDAPELNQWMPLVKRLLAIPYYIVPFFLDIGAFVTVVIAWVRVITGVIGRP